MDQPRSISDQLHWKDLTEEERRYWEAKGYCPYDRSQDRTADEMIPVYEARGFKRKPPSVRGHWDDLTDEQYARLYRHFTPELFVQDLQRRGLDVICVHPPTLAAVAKIDVQYQRDKAAGVYAKPAAPAKPPAPEPVEPELPKGAPLGWPANKPYSMARLISHLDGLGKFTYPGADLPANGKKPGRAFRALS